MWDRMNNIWCTRGDTGKAGSRSSLGNQKAKRKYNTIE